MKDNYKSNFVTGGTGLVGSHLLYALAEAGEKTMAIYRTEAKLEAVKKIFGYYSDKPGILFDSIEWVKARIDDIESLSNAMRGSDLVYHCAAEVSYDPSEKDRIIRNNVILTQNVVESCLGLGISKLCHVSSVAAIGEYKKEGPVTEDREWDNSVKYSPYAASKHLSEEVVWEGIRKGLRAVIINPSIIFGPGDWDHGSSAFFSGIRKGMYFYTRGVTGYVDVRDVASSMIRLMKSPVSGERYIVSSENLSFKEVFNLIADNLGVRRPFIYVPPAVSWPALWIVRASFGIAGKKSPVTADNMRSAYSFLIFNNSKIIRETGLSFIPVRKSIEDTCRIYMMEMDRRKDAIQ